MKQEFATSPMIRKQAGLKRLASLLEELRVIDVMKENRPGIFRLKSKAFLHFHYHPDGNIVAEVRMAGPDFVDIGDGWTRFEVWARTGQLALIGAIREYLGIE